MHTEMFPVVHVYDVSLSLVTTGGIGYVETTLNDVMVQHVVKVFLIHHLIAVGVLVVIVQGRLHARQLITIVHTEVAIVAVFVAAIVVIVTSVIIVGVVVDFVMSVVFVVIPELLVVLVVLLVDHLLVFIL